MKETLLIMQLDVKGSFRSRWFIIYCAVFVAVVALVFVSGVTDSRIMGFTGLTRSLLIFIQACNIIMPIFILITTVRSIVGDRDNNILEYLLSFPISLKSYYWGKFLGRFVVIFIPLAFSLIFSLVIGFLRGGGVPLDIFALYIGLLGFNALAFLGIGFFISSCVKNQELGVGVAFFIWLLLIAFIDIALIGFLIKSMLPESVVFSIALLNPVQVFRISAVSLFDPVLSVIGPSSYFILDMMGRAGFIIYSLLYPILVGIIFSVLGYYVFIKKDIA